MRNIISSGNKVMLRHDPIGVVFLQGVGRYEMFMDDIDDKGYAYAFMHFPLVHRVAIHMKDRKYPGLIVVKEETLCVLNQNKLLTLDGYTNEDVKAEILKHLSWKYRLGGIRWITSTSKAVIRLFRNRKFWKS